MTPPREPSSRSSPENQASPSPLELESVGTTLVYLRLLSGVSQAELARRAGIRPNQVSRYETGQVLPQLAQLDRITTAIGLSISDFFLINAKLTSTRALVDLLQGATSADPHVQVLISSMLAREAERERTTVAKLAAFLEARPNATNDD